MRNVCGLDVHKDNVFVCIDKRNGEKIQFKCGILTRDLDVLRDKLVENDVGEIAMESTSVYWMPIWRVLESDFKLYLVNPYAIKQLPGRKSDVKDAEWIATCLRKDLIRGSYVPDATIQQLRQYNRRIFDINKLKRSSCWSGGTEGQYEDRVVRLEDISMGINPTLDYLSVPSTTEVKAGAATAG